MNAHKWWPVMALGLLALGAGVYTAWPSSQAASEGRTPVLVELFTSEGCSSCPPADNVLARLVERQPVAGAEIIALSEHVDYWNSLGWIDPFSAAQFTDRQNEYARALDTKDVYTPQMVVDGRAEFVGSNAGQAMQAAALAARRSKASITVSRTGDHTRDTDEIVLRIQVGRMGTLATGDSADVYLALTEDNLLSKVVRGENQGRMLHHDGVVRKLGVIGSVEGTSGGFAGETAVSLLPEWKRGDLHIIVFAQSRGTREVLAATSVPFTGIR